jgi:hypothetical protein
MKVPMALAIVRAAHNRLQEQGGAVNRIMHVGRREQFIEERIALLRGVEATENMALESLWAHLERKL